MTPEQCRAARELLNWSQDDLARASRVPVEIIAMFEDGKLVGMMDCQVALREALEPAWHWLISHAR
jgi:ribosome-binding protein aMBF1 (putative translation factor)